MKKRVILLTVVLAMFLVGCASQPTPSPTGPTPVPSATSERVFVPFSGGSGTSTPGPTPTSVLISPLPGAQFTLDDAVEMAKADLAARLGVDPESITVKRAVHEEMPIQDVECGQPSEDITIPAFVMGYEVVLEAQGQTYVYRGRGRRMKLCEQGQGKSPREKASIVLDKVVADLAAVLGVEPEEVKVVSVEEVIWPDTSLGCPEPGKVYAQVLTRGYRIVLEAKGDTYEYHTDTRGHFTRCPR